MILKKIALQIDIDKTNQYLIDYTYEFYKKTRHICNFIERECLKKIKFNAEGFSKVVVSLKKKVEVPYINSSQVLCISIPFNKEVYDACKSDSDFRNFIIKCIKDGIKSVKKQFYVPSEEILSSLLLLKSREFENKWLFKKKQNRIRKIVAQLICNHKIDKFELKLIVNHNDEIAFDKIIFESDPDEIAYDYKFKDILINEDSIIITNKINGKLFELNFKSI